MTNSNREHQLEYQANSRCHRNKKRQRNITWYNPPFSRNVTTNVGKQFFKILDREFPKGSKLHKIFNRNTVKLSYSCMKNIGGIIKQHNSKLLRKSMEKTTERQYNCRIQQQCPMNGKCLSNTSYTKLK